MKAEGLQNGEARLGRFVVEIHPEKPAPVPSEFGEFIRKYIFAYRLAR
jgi:hypothetical protein